MAININDHTILLLQMDSRVSTRIWADFGPVSDAINDIIRLYEDHARSQRLHTSPSISYELTDIYRFIDSLHEACCMQFSPKTNQYIPHDKTWIKDQILNALSPKK